MNNCYEYLTLPPIPDWLNLEIYQCAKTQPNIFPFPNYPFFKIFPATDPILAWTKENFGPDYVAQVQILSGDVEIHTDFGRTFAINYILETGGDNVFTCFYDRNNVEVDRCHIKKHQWAKLNVTVPHNVIGFTPGLYRVALSVCNDVPTVQNTVPISPELISKYG